jgi:hypothetical protein
MHRSIREAVASAIPADRPFTVLDILSNLQANDASRTWRRRSIARCLAWLHQQGAIERLRRAQPRQPVVYARTGLGAQAEDARTLPQVLDEVLVRPMTLAEIVSAVVDGGYTTNATPRDLRNRIARLLRERGFRRDGDWWSPAKASSAKSAS